VSKYIQEKLKLGQKVTIGAYDSGTCFGKIHWGDRIVLVPLPASVKKGDLVWCDVNTWRCRVGQITAIRKEKVYIKYHEMMKSQIVPINKIYALVYEIRRTQDTNEEYDEYLDED
jgi:hypothetical protein